MILSNSIFKGLIECPARTMAEHGGTIREDGTPPEWNTKTTEAMACGSLVDAFVTKGMTTADDIHAARAFLASSYSDGSETLDCLTTKKGEWTAAAKTAIRAAERLLADCDAAAIINDPRTLKQARLTFQIAPDVTWRGDIDLLVMDYDCTRVIDLKAPGKIDDGWIASDGKNFKVEWWEAWQYWFQLSGYAYGLAAGGLVNGSPFERHQPIKTGLLYTTRSEFPAIGYRPVPVSLDVWENIVVGRLPAIRAIVSGAAPAPMCGHCDYCASRSRVQIADCDPKERPIVDDVFYR